MHCKNRSTVQIKHMMVIITLCVFDEWYTLDAIRRHQFYSSLQQKTDRLIEIHSLGKMGSAAKQSICIGDGLKTPECNQGQRHLRLKVVWAQACREGLA